MEFSTIKRDAEVEGCYGVRRSPMVRNVKSRWQRREVKDTTFGKRA